ncbi:unnamed protein product [Closterium sp. NIES-54]
MVTSSHAVVGRQGNMRCCCHMRCCALTCRAAPPYPSRAAQPEPRRPARAALPCLSCTALQNRAALPSSPAATATAAATTAAATATAAAAAAAVLPYATSYYGYH